jgi:hypothetical protein
MLGLECSMLIAEFIPKVANCELKKGCGRLPSQPFVYNSIRNNRAIERLPD